MAEPIEPPDLKMSDSFSLTPNLGLPTGPMPNNQASAEKAHVGVQTLNPLEDTFSGKDIPGDVVRSLISSKRQVDQYQQLYNDLIAENLRKQQRIKEHPWQNALAEIAASMARNDPNPYTRGIGQAATRLNPSMDELQQKERGLVKEAETLAVRQESLDTGLLRMMEGMDAKRLTNFNRSIAVGEAAARAGNDNKDFYLGLLKRNGVEGDEAESLAAGFAKQGEDTKKVKAAQMEWQKTKTLADQKIRADHNHVIEEISRSRQRLAEARQVVWLSDREGKTVDIPKMMAMRERLVRDLATIQAASAKSSANLEARQAEIDTKYGAIQALDPTGTLKAEIAGHMSTANSYAEAGRNAAGQSVDEIRDMIGQIDARLGAVSKAAPTETPKSAPMVSSHRSVEAPMDRAFMDAFKKEVSEGKIATDKTTGKKYKKVNGQPVLVGN
jgi:hypothetical protein